MIEKAWHYETHANMWRITDDFWDRWDLLKDMFYRCELWQSHVAPGCYPDCDMLPLGLLGKGFGQERPCGFTREEQRTMMTLWCLFGSPLMLGAEMTKLDEWTLSLLTNRDILGMLPPRCKPRQIRLDGREAVWKALDQETGEGYVALFQLRDEEGAVRVEAQEFGCRAQDVLRELWSGEETRISEDGILQAQIPAHGCRVYKLPPRG